MIILYLAHDLDDAAIARRTTQFKRGGARVSLAGFRRRKTSDAPPQDVVAEFGRTADGRLGRRVLSVASTAFTIGSWGGASRGCNVVVARGLEMLVLGALLCRTYSRKTPLVYECLDIHRLMVSPGLLGRALRRLEGRLLRGCALLITSSPAFIDNYFLPIHRTLPPTLLWENRMLATEVDRDRPVVRPQNQAPWRIGWFGVIRCERSLQLLQGLCLSLPGQVEVEIRGRPTRELAPKLEAAVASTSGLSFGGSYDRSRDLSDMYGRVHFTWAIDFFEEDANSAWLLPNRLYEGAAHAAVPIALRSVETGRWLARHGYGVLLGTKVESELLSFFKSLDAFTYQTLAKALNVVDQGVFRQSDDELVDIVVRLAGLKREAVCQEGPWR